LLRTVAQELRPHASSEEMDAFMRRHTAMYSLDQKYHHEYAGIVPQTKLDRILFDRQVQVALKVTEDITFEKAEVRVYYTFL
jgi:hypothetical protein